MKFNELLENEEFSEDDVLADLKRSFNGFEIDPERRSDYDLAHVFTDTAQLGEVKLSAGGKAKARRYIATFALNWLKRILTDGRDHHDTVPAIADAHNLLSYMSHVKQLGVIDVPELKQVFDSLKKHISAHVDKHDVHR